MFARLPLMSHSAMSTPLIALKSEGPLRQYELIYDDCQTSSISSTLRPIRKGFRYFSTAVWTTKARWVNVAHPQPCRPGSVVSTLTMTRRMRSGAVRMVLMSRILTGERLFNAFGFSCANASDRGPAGECDEIKFAPSAAAPSDNQRKASRRFIANLLINLGLTGRADALRLARVSFLPLFKNFFDFWARARIDVTCAVFAATHHLTFELFCVNRILGGLDHIVRQLRREK